jgi:hypothetical protein
MLENVGIRGVASLQSLSVCCDLGSFGSPPKGPMWGHPVPVLGAISPFLEPFRGRVSSNIDNVSENLTLRYPHEGPWVDLDSESAFLFSAREEDFKVKFREGRISNVPTFTRTEVEIVCVRVVDSPGGVQWYLAHKKQPPPLVLQ